MDYSFKQNVERALRELFVQYFFELLVERVLSELSTQCSLGPIVKHYLSDFFTWTSLEPTGKYSTSKLSTWVLLKAMSSKSRMNSWFNVFSIAYNHASHIPTIYILPPKLKKKIINKIESPFSRKKSKGKIIFMWYYSSALNQGQKVKV